MNILYAATIMLLGVSLVGGEMFLRGALPEEDHSVGTQKLSADNYNNAIEESHPADRELATTGDMRACKWEVTAGRTGLVTLLKNLAASGKTITYTQGGSRWSGITSWTCPVANKVPTYADCSSFVTWVFWTAYGLGEDKLNKQSWKAGYTGTMATAGVQVSKSMTVNGKKTPASYANAQPGDIVLYGSSPHVHVAIYIGNGQVANFGSTGPVKILNINYHTSMVEQIRSVIGTATNQF